MDFNKRTWAEIDTSALIHNLKVIKENARNKEIMAVIKSDAYGHSDSIIATALWENGVKYFAVSNIDEAIRIRELGITCHLLILGYTPTECVEELVKYDISQTVYCLEYAKELSHNATLKNVDINIHLKLDTGMGRIGFDCRDDSLNEIKLAVDAAKLPHLIPEGVFTHFSVASDTTDSGRAFTKRQQDLFKKSIKILSSHGINPPMIHSDNSAAVFTADDDFTNFCRPGIILYGLCAFEADDDQRKLIPVMTLKSVVSMVKTVRAGDAISYGKTFIADRNIKIATVTAGYGDGYPRFLSNVGEVIIHGQRAKILGRVCMDQFMIDVSHVENVKCGDEVILFGKDITATKIADIGGAINYEIICGVSKRVPRISVKNKI